MRLAIADPPYPPLFRERFDLAGGASRVTARSRATRWYGEGPRSSTDSPRADLHPEAAKWDDLSAHRELLLHLVENFDGWAIATPPDGLVVYHPLPINAQVMSRHKPTAMPGGGRLIERWEPVIVYIPEERRTRAWRTRLERPHGRGTVSTRSFVGVETAERGHVGCSMPDSERWRSIARVPQMRASRSGTAIPEPPIRLSASSRLPG